MNSIVVIGARRLSSLEEVKVQFKEMGVVVKQTSNPLYISFDSIGFPERVLDIVEEFYDNNLMTADIWAELLYMDLANNMVSYRKFKDGIWETVKSDDRRVYIIGINYNPETLSQKELFKLEEEKKIMKVSFKQLEKMFNLKMLDPNLVNIVIYDNLS